MRSAYPPEHSAEATLQTAVEALPPCFFSLILKVKYLLSAFAALKKKPARQCAIGLQ